MTDLNKIFNQRRQPGVEPLFIFEMANNHMGDVEHGLKIIREIGRSREGLPAGWHYGFKFQYRDLATFIHPDYKNRLDLKYVKRFSETRLSDYEFMALKKEAENLGFITICTPFDEASAEKVAAHGYDIIKIASASFNDWPLLEKIAGYDRPIIASVGGVKLEDIDKVISFFQHRGKKLAIMHCVGQYPTPAAEMQLNQINFLQTRYPEVTIGFSTHEAPDNLEAIKMAIAKGAGIFEKHVGIKSDKYPLNGYSATPEQAREWLKAAELAFKMCGASGRRHDFAPAELADIRQFQRGVFAAADIKTGDRVEAKNVFYAFPNQPGQILANELSKYTIFLAKKDYKKNEPIMAEQTEKTETREKVYEIVSKINELLKLANIPVSSKWDFELSHHYGLEKFYETGAAIASCVNREYCKKLIAVLPGQRHPCHHHKIKEETFNVLHGDITFELNGNSTTAKAGDIIVVERGVKHSFYSANGCVFEEISTTHVPGDSYYEDENILNNQNRKTALTYWII